MRKEKFVSGYKITDSEMKCRGYQYSLNKRFKQDGELEICENGFHFCDKVNNCFNYYDFNTSNRVFEIKAFGKIVSTDDKSCCLEIEFVRELSWEEVLKLANIGANNTGHSNSGYRNSGYSNSGGWNSGDWNSGDRNSGDRNSGYRNSGYRNSGGWNSGDWNSGDRNSGYSNSGYRNSGDRNSGGWNSGDWNSGDRNSGDSNSGYRNSGAFCTDENPYIFLFNKPSKLKIKEWEDHRAVSLMRNLDPTIWVPASVMTDEEKENHPHYETTEGYLKTISLKEAWKNMWHNLDKKDKEVFTTLPNFDWKIFTEITGITKI